jgi:hypothetical protein
MYIFAQRLKLHVVEVMLTVLPVTDALICFVVLKIVCGHLEMVCGQLEMVCEQLEMVCGHRKKLSGCMEIDIS